MVRVATNAQSELQILSASILLQLQPDSGSVAIDVHYELQILSFYELQPLYHW
jgi:hypothetical protein